MMKICASVFGRVGRSFSSAARGEGGIVDRAEQSKGAMKEFMKNVSSPNGSGAKASGVWDKLINKSNPVQMKSKGIRSDFSQDKLKLKTSTRPNLLQDNKQAPAVGTSTSAAPPTFKVEGTNAKSNNVKKTAPRVLNNKHSGHKKVAKSNDGALFTAMGGERSKARRNRDDQEEEKKSSWDKIPDAIQPLLFDHEFFAKKASEANRIIDSKMDPLDSFLAEAFIGSFKTSDNSYQTFIESAKGKGVNIPQARSVTHLQHSMLPRMDVPQHSSAYLLAEEAWRVVQHNHFYTDRQKAQLVDGIAAQMILLHQKLDSKVADNHCTSDMIFDPTFRKGIPGIEKENRDKLLSQNVVKIEDGSDKGETNWDVTAVEDEDLL